MALTNCPECDQIISDTAATCSQCGRPNPYAAPPNQAGLPSVALAPADSELPRFPFVPIATHKFIVLSIFTLGIYYFYWCYLNWRRIRDNSGERIRPFWRAFFAPLWGFALFRYVRDLAVSEGVTVNWNPTLLATLFLVLNAMWRLPRPWWWISYLSLAAIVPVQVTSQRINERHAGSVLELRNDNYSGWNVVVIVLGSIFLILAILGTLMPSP